MASNSKAERILQHVVTTLEGVASIKTVGRVIPTFDEVKKIPGPQLPRAVVALEQLPRVADQGNRANEFHKRVQSDINASIRFYLIEREGPDAEVLDLADDIWSALLDDPTRGGWALDTSLTGGELAVFGAIVAGRINMSVRYLHDSGGI